METERKTLSFHNQKIRKPFRTYDVSEYDEIYIIGDYFPLQMKSNKLIAKENRPPKPFCRIKDMYLNLEKENIAINDKEKEKIEEILIYTNYHRLSVYRFYLENDQRTLSRMLALLSFDERLRALISKMLPTIENALKASFAHAISRHYMETIENNSVSDNKGFESLCYLSKDIYKDEVKEQEIKQMLSTFAETLNLKQEKDPTIRHHLEYYGGHIPIWVLVEFITLGNMFTIARNLDRAYRKVWTDYLFGEGKINNKWMVEWIRTIQLLRNTCAHNARLYGSRPTYNPKIIDKELKLLQENIKNVSEDQQYINKMTHTVFAGILTMKYFYKTLPKWEINKWNDFIDELESTINEYDANLYYIGFPENWKSILIIK